MKKRRIFSLVLSLCLLCALLAGCGSDAAPETTAPGPVVRIGVLEPETGSLAAGGYQEILGIAYANQEHPTVNIGGFTYTVELVYADATSDPAAVAEAATALVEAGVSIVLGPYSSALTLAAAEVFDAAGIPAITAGATETAVTKSVSGYFRLCHKNDVLGGILASFAAERFSARTAYLLGEYGSSYDQELLEYFQAAFQAAGGTVIIATFPAGTEDFTSYFDQAEAADADVFFAPVSIANASALTAQAAEYGLSIPLLGADTWDSAGTLAAAAGSDLSLYVSTFYQEGDNPEFDAGIRLYLQRHEEALAQNGGTTYIPAMAALGYDAYCIALEALQNARTIDPAAVEEALWETDYTGVTGEIRFDSQGCAQRDTVYLKRFDAAGGTWALDEVRKAG